MIQINPTARPDEPKTVLDITDRRNELSGNLSLYQELHGIEVIDRLLASAALVGDRYKHVTVRILEFARPRSSRQLGPASKLNRDARFIRELMALGEQQAEEFLAMLAFERAWRLGYVDAVLAVLAPDVELVSVAPFRPRDGLRGDHARAEVAELCTAVKLDLTRKQLTANARRGRSGWAPSRHRSGRVDAEIADGRVTRLRLGPS